MTSPARPVASGIAVALIMIATTIIVAVAGAASVLPSLGRQDVGHYLLEISTALTVSAFRCVVFGAGVAVAVRWFARRSPREGWRSAAVRVVLISLCGAALVFVVVAIFALAGSFSPGQYPFGYDFEPSVDPYSVARGVESALYSAVYRFAEGFAAVGLVLVWTRVFPRAVPESATETSGPAVD